MQKSINTDPIRLRVRNFRQYARRRSYCYRFHKQQVIYCIYFRLGDAELAKLTRYNNLGQLILN